ncbi:hypothetical protein [Sphingomonas sp. 3F27E9-B]|jgi:hypothetical protein|nr:hypothetical protein [Sphingomonas sp. 3F27E9-B]MCP4635374.1 hypothetical protein [Methyloversatilis sp.]
MSAAEAALRNAIEEAYRAFADVPAPQKLEASPLRDADATLRTLTASPLRRLGDEQIGPYSGWAMTTMGDARAYRHFLPRILELSVARAGWLGAEPVIMADKLAMAGWRDWPADQQRTVLGFFHAAFMVSRARHPEEDEQANLWLAALITLGEPLAPLFEAWCTEASPNAALQLALFIQREGRQLHRHGEVRGPFWNGVDVIERRALAQLLRSGETRALLESALARVAGEDRWLLGTALAELERKF